MGMNVGDCVDDVLYNRVLVSKHAGIPLNHFVFASQIHGDNIKIIEEDPSDNNSYTVIKATDGLITNITNLALVILVADCVPVLLFDPEKKTIGAFHAGWRGLTNGIVSKGVEMMHNHYDCQPASIKAFIGPSIGQCCYEIRSKVIEAVKTGVPNYQKTLRLADSRTFLDLKKGAEQQLLNVGLERQNIVKSKYCTKCYSKQFFSYRAENETGRFCAAIALRS